MAVLQLNGALQGAYDAGLKDSEESDIKDWRKGGLYHIRQI